MIYSKKYQNNFLIKEFSDYKEKIKTKIRAGSGRRLINKMSANIPPVRIRLLNRAAQIKEYRINEKLFKANPHWNG